MNRPTALSVTLLSLLTIAVIDFQSGVELRTFPLYYAPIALAAWHFGRSGALAAAVLASLGWFVSNQLAGLQYTNPLFWVFNTLVQGSSFAIVGWLVGWVATSSQYCFPSWARNRWTPPSRGYARCSPRHWPTWRRA